MNFKTMKGELIPSIKLAFDKDILCCKYSPNKLHMIAGFTDGKIEIFESGTVKPFGSTIRKSLSQDKKTPVTSIQFKHRSSKTVDSTLLATYTDGKVRLWNYETGELIREQKEDRQTLGAVYHPKLAKFVTVGDNGAIYMYDEETMHLEHVYDKGFGSSELDGHSSRVFAAVFHPQQMTEFISGGWDNLVYFWDMRQSNALRFIKGIHICGEGLDISQSGRELLTCAYSRNNALQLWNYQTGRLLSNIEPDTHKSKLYCGQWLTPDYILTGGTDPSLARIVSLRTLSTVLSLKGSNSGVYCIDHCPKPGRNKRESNTDFKILIALDKMLIESDVSL